MATREELLQKSKADLEEMARERELKGRSGMSKEELAEALADDGGSSDEEGGAVERGDAVAVNEEMAEHLEQREEARVDRAERLSRMHEVDEEEQAERQRELIEEHDAPEVDVEAERAETHHSPASDPEVVKDALIDSDREALDEMGEDSVAAMESDLALAASGPLTLDKPSERVMTGAVSPGHAEEQEELLKNKPEDYVGDVTEAGFDEEGQPVTRSSEEMKRLAEAREERFSKKENLGPDDDREIYEVYQENVIDFEAPLAEREKARTGEDVDPEATMEMDAVAGAPFATSPVAGSSQRAFSQKSVFYTDGLSGGADSNLERAYVIPELLQSNDPDERAAGDESESEAAKEAKSEEDQKRAENVKEREDDPKEAVRNRDK